MKLFGKTATLSRLVCHFPSCNETYYQKTSFLKHLKEKHRVSIEVKEHTFASEGHFLVWKEKQETEQLVYFSKQTGEKSGNNCKLLCYSSHQDGHNKPHRAKGEPARKTNVKYKHGSIKIGKFCPARMIVRIEPGKTSVVYIKSHNHPINIYSTQFQPIPKSVKNGVAAKLAFGVPVPQIYRDLRSTLGGREQSSESKPLSKTHLITKKNITDIKRVMSYGRRLHPYDSTSTYLLVKKLEKEAFNSVVVYKPQGETTVIGPKSYDDMNKKIIFL